MTLPLGNRCSKTQKIRILPIAGCDPECQRTEMIKKEERLRASTHQTIHLWEKQSQQRLSVPYQDPNSIHEEEEGAKAIKNHYQGELQGELRMEIRFRFHHLRTTEVDDGRLLPVLL